MRKKTLVWSILTLVVLAAASIAIWSSRQTGVKNVDESSPEPGAIEEQAKESGNVANVTAPTQAEVDAAKKAGKVLATIDTARGKIEVELRGDLMPLTVANFTKLANAGFYDGLKFHRVENWVIQGGDPQGNGMGGPGYAIKLETHPQMKNLRGALAMARSQNPDSAGSQFYILRTDAAWLDGQYAVFGNVKSGLDVVDKMQPNDAINKVTIGK